MLRFKGFTEIVWIFMVFVSITLGVLLLITSLYTDEHIHRIYGFISLMAGQIIILNRMVAMNNESKRKVDEIYKHFFGEDGKHQEP